MEQEPAVPVHRGHGLPHLEHGAEHSGESNISLLNWHIYFIFSFYFCLTHFSIQVSDPDLYVAMKTTLMRSLQQSVLMKQFALQRNIPVRFHGHGPNEPVNYCLVCEEEVQIFLGT